MLLVLKGVYIMTMTIKPSLSEQQIVDYHEDGYLIVRNVLSAKEADELRRVVQQEVMRDAYPSTLKYPQTGEIHCQRQSTC